jgi:hypothetical protein
MVEQTIDLNICFEKMVEQTIDPNICFEKMVEQTSDPRQTIDPNILTAKPYKIEGYEFVNDLEEYSKLIELLRVPGITQDEKYSIIRRIKPEIFTNVISANFVSCNFTIKFKISNIQFDGLNRPDTHNVEIKVFPNNGCFDNVFAYDVKSQINHTNIDKIIYLLNMISNNLISNKYISLQFAAILIKYLYNPDTIIPDKNYCEMFNNNVFDCYFYMYQMVYKLEEKTN